MTKRGLLFLTVLCFLATVLVGTSRADDARVISGQVRNGSQGGGSTAGLEVTAWVLKGAERSGPYSVVADEQGAFRFDNLESGEGYTYLLQAIYEDVTYSQGPLQFEPGQTELDAPLTVYETTTDDSAIKVELAHLFISVQEGSLSVAELHVFTNPGDRTYIGNQEQGGIRWATRFVLPENSRDLALSDGTLGGRFLATSDGFVDREPLWPGRTSVMFRYRLDGQDQPSRLVREITYPTDRLNVLLPDVGLRIESQQLQPQGKVAAEGQNYLNYVANGLQPGQRLEFTVYAPASSSQRPATQGGQTLPWLLLGAIVVVAVLGYPFWRQHLLRTAGSKTELDEGGS